MKSLNEEVKKLNEQMKDYDEMKQRVIDLETKLDTLVKENNQGEVERIVKCRHRV